MHESFKVELQIRKSKVAEELHDVQPKVDAAREAVRCIRSSHLNEIRSLKMPPEAIRDVLEGVLTVLGQRDLTWNAMCRFLSNRSVKDKIICFDPRGITKSALRRTEHLLQTKEASFTPEVIQRVSLAAVPLAAWVQATLAFCKVLFRMFFHTKTLKLGFGIGRAIADRIG